MDPLAQVYRDHVQFVWRYVRRLGVADSAVPDAVQDVFLVVHRRLPDYDGRAPLRAWLVGICKGVVRNYRRSWARHERRLRLVRLFPQRAAELGEDEIILDRLRGFLDGLEHPQREVLVLADLEGMSPAEVAAALGVSRNTVYSRLRVARQKLRRHLASTEGVWEACGESA